METTENNVSRSEFSLRSRIQADSSSSIMTPSEVYAISHWVCQWSRFAERGNGFTTVAFSSNCAILVTPNRRQQYAQPQRKVRIH